MRDASLRDVVADLTVLAAYMMVVLLGLGFIVTGGDGIGFEKTVVLMLLNHAVVSLHGDNGS